MIKKVNPKFENKIIPQNCGESAKLIDDEVYERKYDHFQAMYYS